MLCVTSGRVIQAKNQPAYWGKKIVKGKKDTIVDTVSAYAVRLDRL